MSEEIENAAMNVPRAIVTTVLLNGSTGWAMVLAVLFCLGDIDSVIVCFAKPPFPFSCQRSSHRCYRILPLAFRSYKSFTMGSAEPVLR